MIGAITITLDVAGADLSTRTIANAELRQLLFKGQGVSDFRSLPYFDVARGVADRFTRAKQARDDAGMQAASLQAIWIAFNHPKGGWKMWRTTSAIMHRRRTPHITWQYSQVGLRMALIERLEGVDEAPRGCVTLTYHAPRGAETVQALAR